MSLPSTEKIERLSQNRQDLFNFFSRYLPKNPTIIECGGFTGDDTVQIASFWSEGSIYTFEPVPQLFYTLSQRTENFKNIKPFQLALADQSGKMTFYFSDYLNTGLASGSSSLLPPKDHLKFDHKATFNETIEVEAITLDEWAKEEGVDHIDLMWLDMQGFELQMLKTSKLALQAKLVYMEVEFVEAYLGQYLYPDVKKWMEENGFELIAIDFDEPTALMGDKVIKPGAGILYYGNALFLNHSTNRAAF